jgi:hypothetical protein
MKSSLVSLIAILLYVLVSPSTLFCQHDSPGNEVHRIELKDGSVIIGTILAEDSISIKFRTLSNVEMIIQKEQIISMEVITGKTVAGEFWRKDPNETRLMFATTGRALKAGQGYFSVYEIFFPFFAFGITDFFAVAGGMTLFPGAEEQLLYIAPKITPFRFENIDIAAGVLYMKIPDEEEGTGIVYGVGTYGTERAALTFGVGFAFSGGDLADKPIFVLGGELRTSKSLKIITENWILPDGEVQLLSLGVRFFGKKLAADFGLIYPAGGDTGGFPFVPWIGFAYNFGSKE